MLLLPQAIKEYTAINIEDRWSNWNAGTTYNFGDIAFYGHYYYKSVIDGNVGRIPEDDTTHWLRWDVSNRYAQIDLQATTKTTCDHTTKIGGLAPYTLISEFQNDRYDAIALGEVYALSVTIEILDSLDAVVWTYNIDMARRRPNVNSWYDYYYIPKFYSYFLDLHTKNCTCLGIYRHKRVYTGVILACGGNSTTILYGAIGKLKPIFLGQHLH